jgi:LTXXQ motif family protein
MAHAGVNGRQRVATRRNIMRTTAIALVTCIFLFASHAFATAQSYNQNSYGSDGLADHLAYVKKELKIGDEQAEQWSTAEQALLDNAKSYDELMRSMMKENGDYLDKPLPEFLTLMESQMETRLEQIRLVRDALSGLYEVLDKDQKDTANELLLPVVGMDMMMR